LHRSPAGSRNAGTAAVPTEAAILLQTIPTSSVVDPDPKLVAGSGVGFGSGSGQPYKTFLIKFTIYQPSAQLLYTSLYSKKTLYIVVLISRIKCEFAAQLSRGGDRRSRIQNRIRIQNLIKSRIRRLDPKQIIPDPKLTNRLHFVQLNP
jgi:hypothetical protein